MQEGINGSHCFDALILQVGPAWEGLRKWNRVDGAKIEDKQPALEDSWTNSPADNIKRLRSLAQESSNYNIGDVNRKVNLPTFALKILHKEQVGRFAFEKAGTDKINGSVVWREVRDQPA